MAYFVAVQFLVLGPLEVRGPDAPVTVRKGRPRAMLHLLLVNRRVALSPEVLADRLWGEEQPVDGANAVHQIVSYLRRALGTPGRALLATTPTGYCLDAADADVDAWEFERLARSATGSLNRASAAAAERSLAEADAALRLWRGEPFAESSSYDWAIAPAAMLKDAYLQAKEVRLEALLALGRHREVVLEAQSLAAAYPLREQFHAQLALGLYRSGRQGDALEMHRSVRALFSDELGLDPGPQLRELEQRILRQDESLDWRPPVGTSRPTTPGSGDGGPPVPSTVAGPQRLPEPTTLPVRRTELFGRTDDVGVVAALTQGGRVVTVAGTGGVGKTRVALEVADEVASTDPVWFVDIGDVADDDHVAGTVADRLGVTGSFPNDPADRVAESLSTASGLLVVDTCEHVVGGVARLLDRLLRQAPGLRLLATSRRPLGLEAEVVHRLAPLPVPADGADHRSVRQNLAVQLFRARARLVRSDFEVGEANAQDVAAVVAALDGLPIAIELAAAHADVSSVAAIRRRISGRLDTLVSQSASLPPRQRSLRAAIEASLVLCSDDERGVLGALSVFPGSFDLPAAEAVAGLPSGDVFGHLSSLVRQSLVVVDGDASYRLLTPIRAFALERLAADPGRDLVHRRHRDWVAAAAEAAGGKERHAGQDQAVSTLAGLLPDARVALEWSLVHDPGTAADLAVWFSWVWTLRGLAAEGIDWLTRVRAVVDAEPGESEAARRTRAAVLASLGQLANPAGRLELASAVCTEAARLRRDLGDERELANTLLTLSVARWALGDLETAAAAQDEAAHASRHWPTGWDHVSALVLRARTALDAAEPDLDERIERAVAAAQATEDSHNLGLAVACRARRLLLAGDPDSAAITAEEALRLWRRIAYREGEMSALNLLGRVRVEQGRVDEAEALCREALAIARLANHRGALCESVESWAMVAGAAGRREQAYLLLEVAKRERCTFRAPVPRADQERLDGLRRQVESGLDAAARLLAARAAVVRFSDVVADLLDGTAG